MNRMCVGKEMDKGTNIYIAIKGLKGNVKCVLCNKKIVESDYYFNVRNAVWDFSYFSAHTNCLLEHMVKPYNIGWIQYSEVPNTRGKCRICGKKCNDGKPYFRAAVDQQYAFTIHKHCIIKGMEKFGTKFKVTKNNRGQLTKRALFGDVVARMAIDHSGGKDAQMSKV